MKAGDKVKWTSQALGCWTEKSGNLIAGIPAGENAMQYVPKTAKKSHIKFKPVSAVDRMLIAVPAGKDNQIIHYYCPTRKVIMEQNRAE